MDNYPHQDNNYRAPDSAGERESGARRPRTAKPAYTTLLENRHLRRMVAGQLGIRADQLRDGPGTGPRSAEQEANDATAELLDDLIDALRAV